MHIEISLRAVAFSAAALLAAAFQAVGGEGRIYAESEGETFGPSLKAVIERHYDVPDKSPVWFGGKSKAKGACSKEYCIYADIAHSDGTFTYKVMAVFSEGTHDWEESGRVVYPKAPVKWVKMYALYRWPFKDGGEVSFKDVFLERRDPGRVPIASRRMTARPFACRDELLVSYPAKMAHENGRFAYVPAEDGAARCGAETTVAPDALCVWTADSMRKVAPLTFPDEAERAGPVSLSLELAKGERESAQILLTTGRDRECDGVTLELSPLVDGTGRVLKGSFRWERLGYLARRPEYAPHPCGPDPCEKWFPEVLLPAAPMRLRKGGTQGAWLTVFAERDAEPGTYAGHADVVAGGKTVFSVPVSVTVWNFALPEKFSFPAMIAVMDGFIKSHYPGDFAKRHREAIDMMLDHRLDWTDISRTSPPDIEDVAYAKSRGQRHVNLLNLVPPPPKGREWVVYGSKEEVFSERFFTYVTNTLTPCIAALKARGLFDGCCIYGFDERGEEYYEGMDRMWKRLKGIYPDLPLITSAYMFRDRVKHPEKASPYWDTTDWHVPSTECYDEETADRLRAKGRQVWWYTCCGPFWPHCNFASYENPTIEGRLIPWLTHRVRSDGYLFWNVNHWNGWQPKLDESDVWFPDWNTWSGLQAPGDGVMAYPGKNGILPSIRLANIRDGSEDYDYLAMAAAKDPEAVKAIERSIARGKKDFTRDPAELRAARRKLAEIIMR